LKRHRFFSDLIDAAHAVLENRVKFDALGPSIAEVSTVESETVVECETPPNSKFY
jgi:hypothetical protein